MMRKKIAGMLVGILIVQVGLTLAVAEPSPLTNLDIVHFINWLEMAKLTASDGASGDYFGDAVSINGNTAIVGGPYHDQSTGAAYIFERTGTTWMQKAELTASDGVPGDEFGCSVFINGNTVIVGAPESYQSTGSAYIFERTGTTWAQEAELTPSDGASLDWFGCSVSINGTSAIVGASGHNDYTGSAYIFERTGATWVQEAELTASDGTSWGWFGMSVSICGNTALVGASGHNYNTGAAYIFERTGTTWMQKAELTASDGTSWDIFGRSVSINGNSLIIGAGGHNQQTGAAYIFRHRGMTWVQEAELTASDGALGDAFGCSVSINNDSVVVGAVNHDQSGAAYIFRHRGMTWTQEAELSDSDGVPGDAFGCSVFINGKTAVAGAEFHNQNIGAAYIFWKPVPRPTGTILDGPNAE